MNLRRAAIVLAVAVAGLSTGTAYASWGGSGSGSGAAKAAQLSTSTAPSASVSVHSVTVTWPATTIGGQSVSGYTVKRYNSGGTAQTVGAGCSGTLSGLTCTEASVPSGAWRYTVTPIQGAWIGAESPQSSSVTVQSPGLNFSSSTTVTSLPATLSASLTSLVPGQAVTFRLDDQNTGTLLTSTLSPTTVPASGSVTATVTIPAGVANGSHTVYAIDGQGDVASASITVAHPTVTGATIAKSAGGTAGYIKQGGTYYVYANVAGSGTPPAGVSTLTADVGNVTTGQTAASLSSGSYTVDGQSYNYRSAQLTAKSSLSAGSKSFTVSLTDSGSTKTTTSYSVMVDNTVPAGSGIQTANAGGGTAGRAEVGDTLTLTYNDQLDPNSLFSGWDGSSMNVAVVLVDGGTSANDTIQVWDVPRVTQIPLGTIDLGRKDYLTSRSSIVYGLSGTPSTMVMNGSTITITLGTPSVTADTATGNGTMTWTPSASATDRAGNASSTAAVTENGSGDKEF